MALLEDSTIVLVINKNLAIGCELLTEGYFFVGYNSEDPTKYSFLPGMTWGEFINSEYNTGDFSIGSSGNMVYWLGYGGYNNFTLPNGLDTQIVHKFHYSYCCYIKGTKITLSNYTTKAVEEITYEDELLVWDFDNGCFSSSKPLWITKSMKATYYYKLTFSDGTELGLVGSNGKCHRLMNIENKEFTYGSYFKLGDHTFKNDSSTPYLVSIEKISEEVEYYNIATKYHMNCFANGILSSTGYNNIYPIEDMKFVKDNREIIPFEQYEYIPYNYYEYLRLGEQDLSKRSISKAKKYINNILSII